MGKGNKTREAFPGGLAALAIAVVPATFCTVLAFWLPPIYDETFLVGPAYAHLINGAAHPAVPYPVSVYIFFETFLRVFFLFAKPGLANAYLLCRLVNIALYLAATLFFYKGLRLFFEKRTAVLGAFFFAWSPVVVLSAMIVKTEALQLAVISAAVWACGRVAKGRARPRDYAAAGLLSGALCLVKYDPLLGMSYLAAVMIGNAGQDAGKASASVVTRKTLRDRNAWLGGLFYLACVALLLLVRPSPSPHELSQLAITPYFNVHPSFLRSVGEGFSFPFGRYSYPLLVFLPLFAGVAVYLGGLAGIAGRPGPAAFTVVWASFSFGYLIFLFSFTLTRQPWVFTPAVPFFAAMAAYFFSFPSRKKAVSALKKALLILAIILTCYQAGMFPALGYGFSTMVIKTAETRRQEDPSGDLLVLFTNEKTSRSGYDASRLRREVAERRPAFLLVLSAYGNDFCRYPANDPYKDACAFFKELGREEAGYRLLWERKIYYPLNSLFSLDPGFRLTFFLFRRQDRPAS